MSPILPCKFLVLEKESSPIFLFVQCPDFQRMNINITPNKPPEA